jgi:hypothetical protein
MRLASSAGCCPAAVQVHHLRAALTVALSRAADGDLGRVTRLGRRRFDAAVRRQVARWDAVHPWQKIIDTVFAACSDPAGVTEMRHGALERIALLLADRRDTRCPARRH